MNKKLLPILLLPFLFGCKSHVSSEAVVYNNDFESNNLTNIVNGTIDQFNGSNVLGQFNNTDVSLTLNNLPKHDLITITFDLYIHDTWDGNIQTFSGPDIWEMTVDGNPYINATFSNVPCSPGNFCAPQSYPANYPNSFNNPKTGAYRTDLPGVCSMKNIPNWTTQYKIEKTFSHSNSTLLLQLLDKLVEDSVYDKKCDESWSVDNITIKAITL